MKEFKIRELTQEMVDEMPPIDYKLSNFLIIQKDYCSDPVWDGHTGANDCLDAYKPFLPDYLYDGLNVYSRVWEVMAELSLGYMEDEYNDKARNILTQIYDIDFTAWEKSLAERCAKAIPEVSWGWREWQEDGESVPRYVTYVIEASTPIFMEAESTTTKIEFKFFGDLDKLCNALYEALNEQEVFVSGKGAVITVEWNKTDDHQKEIDKVKGILVECGQIERKDVVYANYIPVTVNVV